MPQAVEVTTFKLRKVSCTEFVRANADIDEWLLRQPGFISRRIAERADGTILDILIWASKENGEQAARKIMTEMAASPVHDLIEQNTVDWTVTPIRHFLESKGAFPA
jgi:hypothetical protein